MNMKNKHALLLSLVFALVWVERDSMYCQTLSTKDSCGSIVLKCDFYDKRTSIVEDSTNRSYFLYVSSNECDSMNFIIADSEQPKIYRKADIILNEESTYIDTCFYMLYYIQKNYLNEDKIIASVPIRGGKVGKKSFQFYHCKFNHLGIDWVARLDIYEGVIINLQLDIKNYAISKTLIGYFIFSAIRDEQKWKLNKEILLNYAN